MIGGEQRRASGAGAWEDIGSSWQMADALGNKGIPNRVDNWGQEWDHDWDTWHHMLPQYRTRLTSCGDEPDDREAAA